jgi:hypothetical protein
LPPRRRGWTDSLLNFFLSVLQKLEQRAKKCIELCGEYAEYIPSLVAVACFLPGRAKDLSAPPPTSLFSKDIPVVSVFTVYLIMPEMKDYTAMNNWRTMTGDLGRTMTVVVLR